MKTILPLKSLEKTEIFQSSILWDDPFPRYDFFPLICLSFFVCAYRGSIKEFIFRALYRFIGYTQGWPSHPSLKVYYYTLLYNVLFIAK